MNQAFLYDLESTVYFRISGDKGMVTGHIKRPGGQRQYLVTWEDKEETFHWEAELTDEKDFKA